jgi:hypothetical protein
MSRMSREGRLLLRLSLGIGSLLFAAACAAAGVAYNGSRGLWYVIAIGVPLTLLTYFRLRAIRRGGLPPGKLMSDAARRGAWANRLAEAFRHRVQARRRHRRVMAVERAAADAAEKDHTLSPESVRTAAEALFRLVQLAWAARDRGRLATLLAPELLVHWEDQLAYLDRSNQRGRAEVLGDVCVEYVGLANAEPSESARVVVLIDAKLRTIIENDRGRPTNIDVRRICQYWTLGRRSGPWTVLHIEEHAQGKHHLTDPVLP